MPIPKPRQGETEQEFISRCMADEVMNREHPDTGERAGICYTQWNNRKDKKMGPTKNDVLTQEKIDNDLSFKNIFQNLEVKAKKDRGIIEGYASTYDLDLGGDRIIPGAFIENLPAFFKNPVFLFSHKLEYILGKWVKADETENGLFVIGEINLKTQLGREKYELIKAGDLKGLSIGYEIIESEPDKVTGVQLLKKLRLWEISAVGIPMNQEAWITGTKILIPGADMKKEEPKEKEFKLAHDNKNLDFEDVAIDMMKLLGARGGIKGIETDEDKLVIYNDLESHYQELGKKPPVLAKEGQEIKFDKINIADVEFLEDEKFIFERHNLKGNLESIVNILAHWAKEDRELPADTKEKLADFSNNIKKYLELKEPEPTTDNTDIQDLTKTVEDLYIQIKAKTFNKQKVKDLIEKKFSEKIQRVTGGLIK